jgi:hypothetical protein
MFYVYVLMRSSPSLPSERMRYVDVSTALVPDNPAPETTTATLTAATAGLHERGNASPAAPTGHWAAATATARLGETKDPRRWVELRQLSRKCLPRCGRRRLPPLPPHSVIPPFLYTQNACTER